MRRTVLKRRIGSYNSFSSEYGSQLQTRTDWWGEIARRERRERETKRKTLRDAGFVDLLTVLISTLHPSARTCIYSTYQSNACTQRCGAGAVPQYWDWSLYSRVDGNSWIGSLTGGFANCAGA